MSGIETIKPANNEDLFATSAARTITIAVIKTFNMLKNIIILNKKILTIFFIQ